MPFEIIWDEKAQEELDKLEAVISRRIHIKISELQEDPFSKDIKKLKGAEQNIFRLRVGDYRVLFEIDKTRLIILKVGHRKHIYER